MSGVERFWWNDDWMLTRADDGELVKYVDHRAAVEVAEARGSRLEARCAELESAVAEAIPAIEFMFVISRIPGPRAKMSAEELDAALADHALLKKLRALATSIDDRVVDELAAMPDARRLEELRSSLRRGHDPSDATAKVVRS